LAERQQIEKDWREQKDGKYSLARILSGHSLTQRTETAICFSPWG